MYSQSTAQGLQEYISGKLMSQLLCNTSKADSLDANTSVAFMYAWLEDSIMVRQQ